MVSTNVTITDRGNVLFNNKDVKSELQKDVDYLAVMYEDISLRLEVISEIMEELIEMHPTVRERHSLETRIEQKLMLRRLAE